MPGFVAEIGKNITSNFDKPETHLVTDIFRTDSYHIERGTIDKFLADKCFYQDDKILVVLEGVILNKAELIEVNELWEQTVIRLYLQNGDDFFNKFKGSFCGILYDMREKKWLLFTDHIGSRHLYFSKSHETYFFSTDIDRIYSYFRNNNVKANLDIAAAYMVLSYGYMLEAYTLSKEIRKLLPGHYIKLEDGRMSIHQYFRLTNLPDTKLKVADFVEKMDSYFRDAVRIQFQKDLEYGYNHLVGLSGGLDSRMTTWVAHDLGFKNQMNVTFSQSGYLDEIIPKQISRDLNHRWVFKALDGGDFLTGVDNITAITGGNVLYFGLAHQETLYKELDFKNYGVLHSGQLGDVIFGTFYKEPNSQTAFSIGDGAYSSSLVSKIHDLKLKLEYANQEIFNLYNRGFAGANNGLLMAQQYTETMSPFYNIDNLIFALTIPVELRFNHGIYHKWIKNKYPGAANYIWEKTRQRVNALKIRIGNRSIYFNEIPSKASKKILDSLKSNPKSNVATNKHMNPVDFWLKTNMNLTEFFDRYFQESLTSVSDKELKKDMHNLFKSGNGIEKIQVITLLSAIKRYLIDGNQ